MNENIELLKKFRENHPSLINRIKLTNNFGNITLPLTKDLEDDIIIEAIVPLRDIHETQLDKQRVKEVVQTHKHCRHEYCNIEKETMPCWKSILKKLGMG